MKKTDSSEEAIKIKEVMVKSVAANFGREINKLNEYCTLANEQAKKVGRMFNYLYDNEMKKTAIKDSHKKE